MSDLLSLLRGMPMARPLLGPNSAYGQAAAALGGDGLGVEPPKPVYQGGLKYREKDIDEDSVKAVIKRELEHALGQDGGTLSMERLRAIKYYNGEPLGTEVEGRSTIVMRNVLEAVEWVLPALIRIFTASDQICVVEPTKPEDEAVAKVATEYLTHIFYRDNQGFMILHDWFKDALLEKLGWVKYWWDVQETTTTESFSGITREQYDALLNQDPGTQVEVKEEKEYQKEEDEAPGDWDIEATREQSYPQEAGGWNLDRAIPPQPVPVMLYDCTLKITRQRRRVKIENVPPEEILFSRRAKRGVPIPFLAHRRRWTKSDLVQQGYDEDCIDQVPQYEAPEWNTERVERHREDDDFAQYERRDAAREIWVEESYVWLDLADEGTTELYKVMTAGNGTIILTRDGDPDIECVDEVPFVSLCPVPSPHKLVGMSLADLVMDLQLIKSTLFRQMLDNAYLTNWPRIEIGDDVVNENTYDDLMTHRPGGAIRTKRVGGLAPMMIPFTADKSFPLLEYIDQAQEIRTGVARKNQGINADDLNKTATGVMALQAAAAQRVELFARIFSVGVESLMRGVLGLVRRHQQQERVVRLTGGFFKIDPREWQDEMQVSVSVGLGTGNKDQILQYLATILQTQQGIVQVQQGVNGPLVYAQNVYDVLSKMTENAGFKQSFFADPSRPPPPGAQPPGAQKPDPGQAQAQAIVQATQLKAQATVGAVQMKAQADAQSAQSKAQLDAELQRQKAALEAELQQRRLDHELAMEAEQAKHKMLLERQQAEHELDLQRQQMLAKIAIAQRESELRAARPVGGGFGNGSAAE